jgi:hypothetical protein
MSLSERYAYEDTTDSPNRYTFPRLRAFLDIAFNAPSISQAQRVRCLGLVLATQAQSKIRRLAHRLPLMPASPARKTVYQ